MRISTEQVMRVLAYLCVGMTLLWLFVEKVRLELQTSFALDQVVIFTDMISKAKASHDFDQVVQFRDYVEWYYPSGTKQSTGSKLDRIVETVRADARDHINAHLNMLRTLESKSVRQSEATD